MKRLTKRLSAGLVLALALSASAPTAAMAAQVSDTGANPVSQTACTAGNDRGGAAALAALVAAAVQVGSVVVCDVDVLNNSLNNLLQNANVDVLSNILNNNRILNDLTIGDITVIRDVTTGDITISVLGGPVLILQ